MGPPKCPLCGRSMKPLFQTFFCPSDCDKKPAAKVDERWDDEKTDPLIDWSGWLGPRK